jgi:N-methylhydantoinase B
VLGGREYTPEHLTKDEGVSMSAGDMLRLETPGGGGFGDPRKRSPDLVAEDLKLGYYHRQTAEKEYGVVPSDGNSKPDSD